MRSAMVLQDRSIVFGGLLRLRGSRIESVAFAVIVPSDGSHFSYSNVGQRHFRCRHAIPHPECHGQCIHIDDINVGPSDGPWKSS